VFIAAVGFVSLTSGRHTVLTFLRLQAEAIRAPASDLEALTAQFDRLLMATNHDGLRVRLAGPDAWPELTGVVLEQRRQRRPVAVAEDIVHMFGGRPGREPLRPLDVWLGDNDTLSDLHEVARIGDVGLWLSPASWPLAACGDSDGDCVVVDVGVAEARHHLAQGWSVDEGDGDRTWVWSVSRRATLQVELEADHALALSIEMAPMWNRHRSQEVDLSLNGEAIGQWRLASGWNSYALRLPPELGGQRNLITVGTAYTARPSEVSGLQDHRLLGVAVDRFQIGPLP
jgi:hypothetical protein